MELCCPAEEVQSAWGGLADMDRSRQGEDAEVAWECPCRGEPGPPASSAATAVVCEKQQELKSSWA